MHPPSRRRRPPPHLLPGLAALLLAGCTSLSGPEPVEVRLRNASQRDMVDVTFDSGGRALRFERIPAGETTRYERVDRSYRYGFVEVFVEGERRALVPTDYVGERTLPAGRYTFVLSLPDGGLALELRED